MQRRTSLTSTGAGAALGLARPSIVVAQGARVLKFVPQADLASPDPV